ncbi:MAG: hypothetical protein RL732_1238 [Bacteroidota bacterium]
MYPLLIYCYDAYCGWCYGFSPVMKDIAAVYKGRLTVEVLSGGMILPEKPTPISVVAGYIQQAYKTVEDRTGIRFGKDFLWHIFNPDQSDWFLSSEKPAIALCVFKDYLPEQQLDFASDLQYALNDEGRDLCDDEAYRHLVEKYQLPEAEFYSRLHDEAYKEKAYYEFGLCKQLKVSGFPALFLQTSEQRMYSIASGFTEKEVIQQRIDAVLAQQSPLQSPI